MDAPAPEPQRDVITAGSQDKTGTSSQAINVPKGSATVQGMGESFSAQLSTGVATFSVPFAIPPARGAAQPSLALSYSSSSGWGIAGVGWDVGVPFIARQTDRGTPDYDDAADFHHEQDRFVFNGGQELVPICTIGAGLTCAGAITTEQMPPWSEGSQYFRPRVEGSFLRFFWSKDHRTWRVQDKSGITMEFGVPLDGSGEGCARDREFGAKGDRDCALEANPGDPGRIYRWSLVRQYDVQGAANPSSPGAFPQPVNVVLYRYLKDGNASYLSDIYATSPTAEPLTTQIGRFAQHVRLKYQARTDPTTSYRSGWRVERRLRLQRVDVTSKSFNAGDTRNRQHVRRYHLAYVPGRHVSLLQSVQTEGRCGSGEVAPSSAPLEDNFGRVPERLTASTSPSALCDTLPPMVFDYTKVQSFTTAGAPGVEAAPGYDGFDARVRELGSSPPHSVDESSADLFDVNADGLPDILATDSARYPNGHGVFFNGAGGLADTFGSASTISVQGVLGANATIIKLDNPNVSPLDFDGDGLIDLLHMPAVKTYSVYSPRQIGKQWVWAGRTVDTADGLSPKVDLGRDATTTRVLDVNGDGLVDVVRTTGTEIQTYFALGRYPGGNGRFGTAKRTGKAAADLSTAPATACLPVSGTAVSFGDSEVHLGDLNGDGLQDIVKLQRGSLRYWPGRGTGFWGTGAAATCAQFRGQQHIAMASSPDFSDVSGSGLRLDDVNGDGLDDLVQVRFNAIDVWLNVDGTGWTPRHLIASTPESSAISRVRLVDVNGSGTRDILWANAGRYRYIDLQGGGRPWLLNTVQNGLGKTTLIEYGTSTAEMLAAERTGLDCAATGSPWLKRWCTRMPNVAHVVKRVTETDNLSVGGYGPANYVTEYEYRDPVYDGRQREFRGFTHARVRRIGDANSPTDVAESRFLLGECVDLTPADETADCTLPSGDNPREALKGLPVVTEVRDEIGTYLSTEFVTYRLRRLYKGRDERDVRHAFESEREKYLYDTAAGPHTAATQVPSALVLTETDRDWSFFATNPTFQPAHDPAFQMSFPVPRRGTRYALVGSVTTVDPFGNAVAVASTGCVGNECPPVAPGVAANERLTTFSFPHRPAGNETGWLFRVGRSYVVGALHPNTTWNDTTPTYDAKGNATQVTAQLSGSVVLVRAHKAGGAPGPARSGASVDGPVVLATRTYDQFGNLELESGPNGRCRRIGYDPAPGYAQFATSETVYTSGACSGAALVTGAAYDRGLSAITSVVDPSVQTTTIIYDELGRILYMRRPRPDGGDNTTSATALAMRFGYNLATPTRPYSYVQTQTQDAPDVATGAYLISYAFIDGMGRTRLIRSEADKLAGFDDQGVIESGLVVYDAKGGIARAYAPAFVTGSILSALPSSDGGRRYASTTYDAFGRDVETQNYSRVPSLRKVYHPLATDIWDAADIEAPGVSPVGDHSGTFATVRLDGHGRTVQATERIRVSGTMELRHVRTQYLPAGQAEVITRARDGSADTVVRWMRYDSLGRLVLNVDPHTSANFTTDLAVNVNGAQTASSLKAWRYAYNDAGDLIGTSDARGCGVNFFYDGAGRVIAEDFAPCEAHHLAYSAPNFSTNQGIEVFYQYDSVPTTFSGTVATIPGLGIPSGYATTSDFLKGRLAAVYDRASLTYMTYDGRGRIARLDRAAAHPDPTRVDPATRYQKPWFKKTTAYDSADRVTEESTGATTPELLVAGASTVRNTYSARGTLISVQSSYGNLVTKIKRAADGLVEQIEYGDAARTAATNLYDTERRLQEARLERAQPSLWGNPAAYQPSPAPAPAAPTSFQLTLQYERFQYDAVGNPIVITDFRDAAEWPAGAKPVSRTVKYDDLYRVTKVDYSYPAGSDTWVSPLDAERSGVTDPRRPSAAPPHLILPERVKQQVFSYDWLGSLVLADDDRHALWDRGMGPMRTQPVTTKPYQFRDAGDLADPSWVGTGSAEALSHDETGNLTQLRIDRSGQCTNGTNTCNLAYTYAFDELGRLTKAERREGATLRAQLGYAYDSSDSRVLKSDLLPVNAADDRHTVYVFGSLELRRAAHLVGTSEYSVTSQTEVPYLSTNGIRLARVVYESPGDGEPRLASNPLHVFLNVGDHLGSASAVIDHATGELVERMTYQAYGATESDYRPARWKGFREDYRFTGKEEDVEVGLVYFGKRFLLPALGRWLTPDPLAVHTPGAADLNLYAYVHGNVLRAVDPVGLEAQSNAIPVKIEDAEKHGLKPGQLFFVDPRGSGIQKFGSEAEVRAAAAKAGVPVFVVESPTGNEKDKRDIQEALDVIRGLTREGGCNGPACVGGDPGGAKETDLADAAALAGGIAAGETELKAGGSSNGTPGGQCDTCEGHPWQQVAIGGGRAADLLAQSAAAAGVAAAARKAERLIPWSSKRVASAADDIGRGLTEVTVQGRDEAGELFLGLFQGRGFRNTTGMTGKQVRDQIGTKAGTYHWDLADTQHGGRPHLQVHDEAGNIFRIFF